MKAFFEFSLFAIFTLIFSAVNYGQSGLQSQDTEPTVIRLSQIDGAFTTPSLELPAGDYIFEVTNDGVAKDLGFYLQDEEDAAVPNSGLVELIGKDETSRTGVVTLRPGTFRYSCPLNPTPHYVLVVR